MAKILMIVNPVSGKKRMRPLLLEFLNRLEAEGNEVTVSITQRRKYATEVVCKKAKDFDRILCCGGDGTLNEVVTGLMESGAETPIGYIPVGTTNDFASCIGIPTDPRKALDTFLRGNEHPLDVGKFNDSFFSYVASFGAFSAASYNVSQSSKNALGHLAYIFGGINDLKNVSAIHAKCVTPEKTYEDDFVFGGVMNSTSIGGLVKLNKDLVDMNDGEFEVILVRMPKNIVDLNKIARSLAKSDFNNPLIRFFKASEVSFAFENEIPWSLDGEYRNGGTFVSVTNLHGTLHLIH